MSLKSGSSLSHRLAAVGMKQAQLARMTGVSPRSVHAWLKGETPTPIYALTILRLIEHCQGGMRDIRLLANGEQP
jgi:hypothetical protein